MKDIRQYWLDKRAKVEDKYNRLKNKALEDHWNVSQGLYTAQQEYEQDLVEINIIIKNMENEPTELVDEVKNVEDPQAEAPTPLEAPADEQTEQTESAS